MSELVSEFGYWSFNGKNGLVGSASTQEELPDGRILTVKDPVSPVVLEDEFVLYALRTSRQARADFCRLFPTLDSDSQERLTTLIQSNPKRASLQRDRQELIDAITLRDVTSGIHLEPPTP